MPTACFMPELIRAYPDAKVVISERDPDRWYNSCEKTVIALTQDRVLQSLSLLDNAILGKIMPMVALILRSLFGNQTLEPENRRKLWIRRYQEVHDEVRRLVPPEQRLEYQLGSGWEPLCKYLGTEVPTDSFLHVNDSADFGEMFKGMKNRAKLRILKRWLPFAGVITALAVAFYTW